MVDGRWHVGGKRPNPTGRGDIAAEGAVTDESLEGQRVRGVFRAWRPVSLREVMGKRCDEWRRAFAARSGDVKSPLRAGAEQNAGILLPLGAGSE